MGKTPGRGGAGMAANGAPVEFAKTHDASQMTPDITGQRVSLCGWIEDLRQMSKMTFAILRDVTGAAQIILKGDARDQMAGVTRQSAVCITGTVQDTKARDFKVEILAEGVTLLGAAVHPLPVDPIGRLESNIDTRLNHRALDMRNRRTLSVFKMRHHVLQSLRRTLSERGFFEITTPKIIGSASEGGANLFSLDYFGDTAYLAQSPQLYKEQMTMGMERVFEISNFYRAEKSHTGRHLTEFTSVDIEAAFMDYGDVMDILENLMVSLYRHIAQWCSKEQDAPNAGVRVPDSPFERVTYAQCLDELRSEGVELEFGSDLLDSHLRIIGSKHPGFFFLTDWPIRLKPFYIMAKDDDATLSRSFDLQYGYLELSSGGRRLHDPSQIRSRLLEQGLNPAQFADHLQAFEWGMPPHSGWGMGLDRLMTVMLGIDNVREVVLYPRDPDRLRP